MTMLIRIRRLAGTGVSALAVLAGTLAPGTAFAAGNISNSATATGTYNGAPTTSDPSTVDVPLADPALNLAVTKTGVINDGGDGVGPGDTITYTVEVTNNSTVTVSNVTPTEDGITFNGTAGAGGNFGTFSPASAASLAPRATTSFTITYDLDALDVYRAAAVTDGVVNDVTVTGDPIGGVTPTGTDTSQNTIAANPLLVIAKSSAFTTDNGTAGEADEGDVITYTYTVSNTGNVPLTGVTIADTHEGTTLSSTTATSNTTGPWDETIGTDGPLAGAGDAASSDVAVDGSFDLLQPGATATFTYVHTVTQAEFDAQ